MSLADVKEIEGGHIPGPDSRQFPSCLVSLDSVAPIDCRQNYGRIQLGIPMDATAVHLPLPRTTAPLPVRADGMAKMDTGERERERERKNEGIFLLSST